MKTKATVRLAPEKEELEASAESFQGKYEHGAKFAFGPLKLRKILVPLDFSDCSLEALNYALAFAEQFQSQLTLLHVVEPTVYPENQLAIAPALDEVNQNLLQAARDRLETIARKWVAGRAQAEVLVRMGHAHSEIPDTAKALGADLIVIATHGHTGLKHVLLGNTTERVVRYASCPVLTVRQASHKA